MMVQVLKAVTSASMLAVFRAITRGQKDTPPKFFPAPFFYDNEYILSVLMDDGRPDVQPDIEKLQKKLNGDETDVGTQFESPQGPCFNWKEIVWTKRLIHGIKVTLPQSNVTYTTEMGPSWDTDLLKCLGVQDVAASNGYFLFRGAPDIIINQKGSVTIGGTLEDGSEEELIENSFQRPPLSGADYSCLPEKLGEVFAGLHILLICRILKRLAKKKPIDREHKVKGILIDKVCGVVHCSLSVDMKDREESHLNFNMMDYGRGLLTPSQLCSHIKTLAGVL